METFNSTELDDMSQTWTSSYGETEKARSGRNQQEHHGDNFDFPVITKLHDDYSVATPTTCLTGSSLSLQESIMTSSIPSPPQEKCIVTTSGLDLEEDFFANFENLDFLAEDFSPRPTASLRKSASKQGEKKEHEDSETKQRMNNSVSDFRSIDAQQSAKEEPESAANQMNNSFSDFRSKESRRVGMDESITRIPSKAHSEPWPPRLERTSSMPQGKRGRRPSKPLRRSAVASESVGKSPVQRTVSMSAKVSSSSVPGMKLVQSPPVRRPGKNRRSSLVRRNEVHSAIRDALADYDCDQGPILVPKMMETPASPTSSHASRRSQPRTENSIKVPSSPDRRSDFKVLYARTPSTCSSHRRSGNSRVSELVMKVKKSRASFEKMMDESAHRTPEIRSNPSSRRRASVCMQPSSGSMYNRETDMEKQLREKEEMIARLSRELEDAKALNEVKAAIQTKKVRRRHSTAVKPKRNASTTSTRSKRKGRKSALVAGSQSVSSKAKTRDDENESVSGTRKKKKDKKVSYKSGNTLEEFVAGCQKDDSSVASSRRKTKNRVSRSSSSLMKKQPRRSASRLEGGNNKKEPSRKINRTKSEGHTLRRSAKF